MATGQGTTVDDDKGWQDYKPAASQSDSDWQDAVPSKGQPSTLAPPPGGEGFPGVPNPIPSIVENTENDEAAKRLRGSGYNRETSPLSPVEQEQRLNDYNPGGQLLDAVGVASGAGLGRAAVRNPVAVGKTLLGAAGGSAAGGYGGRELGRIVGQPEIGGEVGATLGGLAGGFMGARGMAVPRGKGGILESVFGENEPVDPVRQAVSERRASWVPTTMPKVTPIAPELGSPENPGWHSKLPNRMPELPAPESPLGSPENPGWHSKIPTRMPSVAAPAPELGSPENPGWVVPLPGKMPSPIAPQDPFALAVREGRASMIPTRMPKTTPFEAPLGSPENPGWVTKLPDRMPVKRTPPVSITQPEGSPLSVSPKNAPRSVARPEGRPATWTNDRVKELAAWGDPAAIEQARLRGFGRIPLKYEVAPLTPKEKFTFSEEGEAKRVE